MLSKSSARISNPRSSFCAKTVLKCSTSKTETRESSGDRKRIFWIRTETSWKSMPVREQNRVEAVGKYNYFHVAENGSQERFFPWSRNDIKRGSSVLNGSALLPLLDYGLLATALHLPRVAV